MIDPLPPALACRIDSMDSRLDPDPDLFPSLDLCDPEAERLHLLLGAYRTFVGHDLTNQLVSSQAFARLLEGAAVSELDDESRRLLGRIASLSKAMGLQARRLTEIDNLLREPPWGPPLSLAEAVEEVVVGVRCRMDASKITFRLRESAVLPLDGGLLRRVLLELLTNAVQAIGVGQTGRIDVGGEWSPEGGMIRVGDTGVGLSPARLDALLGTPRVGGLLLVRGAAVLWGGRTHVDSHAGRGTTVTVTMSAATGGRR